MGEAGPERATPRSDRDVAIKVLPTALARDPDRVLRFAREAQRVLASLNHPNIAQIYGIEESKRGPRASDGAGARRFHLRTAAHRNGDPLRKANRVGPGSRPRKRGRPS